MDHRVRRWITEETVDPGELAARLGVGLGDHATVEVLPGAVAAEILVFVQLREDAVEALEAVELALHPPLALDEPGIATQVEEPTSDARLFHFAARREPMRRDLASPERPVHEDRERLDGFVARGACVPRVGETEAGETTRDHAHVALDGRHVVRQALAAHAIGEGVVLAPLEVEDGDVDALVAARGDAFFVVERVQRGLVDLEERPGGHGPGLGAHVERASFARVGAIAIGGRVIREERRDAAYERGALMTSCADVGVEIGLVEVRAVTEVQPAHRGKG